MACGSFPQTLEKLALPANHAPVPAIFSLGGQTGRRARRDPDFPDSVDFMITMPVAADI